MKPYIQVDPEKCTGCMSCEMICSLKHFDVFNPKKARIKVVHYDYLGLSCPVTCIQCPKPQCVATCPHIAMTQLENGLIRIEAQKCNGCGTCVESCIIGAIGYDHANHLALVCDLCGGEPSCVQWCPTGALSLGNPQLDLARFEEGISHISKITIRPTVLKNPTVKKDKKINYTLTKAKKIIKAWGLDEKEADWYAQFGFDPKNSDKKNTTSCRNG